MITSITFRIILIISLLVSMQTSASMLAAMAVMGVVPQNESHAKTACADMPGMMVVSDYADSHSITQNGMSGCDHDACCLVIATICELTFISEKPGYDFQQTSVKSPSIFIKINYRPPILS